MKRSSIVGSLTAIAILTAPALFAADFGRVDGQFDVSSTGAATYSVPIFVPPGPRGVQPTISLNYSSQEGRGLAGIGWNLSAASSIERCKQTKAQDNTTSFAISMSPSDKFCLNGARLRLTSGTYGQANSTYETEVANYSLVTAFGAEGNGPQRFEVMGRNGLIYEYGNTDDSRVKPGVIPQVLRWMLNRVRDRSGNQYVIEYKKDTGFAVPKKISWTPTFSGSTAFRYTADFAYSDDTFKNSRTEFVAGQAVTNRNRLESITISSAGTLVRKYALTYQPGPATQASRLAELRECATSDTSNCFAPTVFTYQDGQVGVTAATVPAPTGSSNNIVKGRYDLNGDGRNDIAYKSGNIWFVAFGASAGFAAPVSTGVSNTATTLLIDRFLPNGRDAIVVPGNPMMVYRWNDASGSFTSVNTGINQTNGTVFAADFDGDRLADLVIMPASSAGLALRRNTSSAASADPTFASSTLGTAVLSGGQQWSRILTRFETGLVRSDINGDGRQDVYGVVKQQVSQNVWAEIYSVVLLGNTTGLLIGPPWNSGPPPAAMNFNGDACTDRWNGSGGGHTIVIAACNGFASTSISAPGVPLQLLDWDGDGKTDLLVNNGGNFGVYLSTGTGFSALVGTSIPSTGVFFTLDQDGDRLDDLIKVNGTGPINYWTHTATGSTPGFATQVPDLLVTTTDGFGVTRSISYVSTSAASNYDKNTPVIFPLQETDPRMVVAQVSTADGIGGTYSKTYFYTGARFDPTRDSFAGFQKVRSTDNRNQSYHETTFSQVFPFMGQVTVDESFQSTGQTISRTQFDYLSMPIVATQFNERVLAHVNAITTSEYEVAPPGPNSKNGLLLSTSVTSYTDVDVVNGNVRNTTTTVTDLDAAAPASPTLGNTWTTTTVEQFSPDNSAANWCLGISTSTTMTQSSTVPGSATVVRTKESPQPDLAKCRITKIVVEPTSTNYRVTTEYQYDDDPGVADPDFGNITKTTVTGVKQNVPMTPRVTTMLWADATRQTGQFPLRATNALGHETRLDYDYDRGLSTSEQDPNGIVTSTDYDAFGRLKKVTRPDGTSTTRAIVDCAAVGYCPGNIRTQIVDRDNDTSGARIRGVTSYLDPYDREVERYELQMGGAHVAIKTQYDQLGRAVQRSAPCFAGGSGCASTFWFTMSHDLRNRLTQVVRPGDNATTSFAYAGRTVVQTDANLHAKTTVTDVNGLVRQITDAANYTVNFSYDAAGRKTAVTDAGNSLQTYRYEYGSAAFMVESTDIDRGRWLYTYNSLGERVGWSDAKNQSFSAEYDELSRMKKRTEPDLISEWIWGTGTVNGSAAYNIGRLQRVAAGTYAEDLTYDPLSRLKYRSITADNSYQFDYAYDDAAAGHAGTGMLASITYPVSTSSYRFKLNYTYQNGVLKQVTDGNSGAPYWTADVANAAGQVTQETFGNNVVTTRDFSPVTGLLSSIKSGVGVGSSTFQNDSYLFDPVGNLQQRQDGNLFLTENVYYDAADRLDYTTLSNNGSTPTTNYDVTYEPNGNVSRWQLDGASANNINYTTPQAGCTYYNHPQIHAVRLSVQSIWATTLCYDENGNRTTSISNGTVYGTNSWKSFNQPNVMTNGANTNEFFYDADHQRWKQIAVKGGVTKTIRYIGDMLEEVTTPSGTSFRHYIPAGSSTAIHTRVTTGTTGTYYLGKDHLGSNTLITDANGAVVARTSYAALGTFYRGAGWTGVATPATTTAMTDVTNRAFTGHEMLAGVNMNGRMYSGVWFLSPDPYVSDTDNPQSYNRYSYVNNNPLSRTDPSGFAPCGIPPIPQGVSNDGNDGYQDSVTVTGYRSTPCPKELEPAGGGNDPGTGSGGGEVLEEITVTGYKVNCVFDAEKAKKVREDPHDPGNLTAGKYPTKSTSWGAQILVGFTVDKLVVADFTTNSVHIFNTVGGQAGLRVRGSASAMGGSAASGGGTGVRNWISTEGGRSMLGWGPQTEGAFIFGFGGTHQRDGFPMVGEDDNSTNSVGIGVDVGLSAGAGRTKFAGTWGIEALPEEWKDDITDWFAAVQERECRR